MGVVFGEIRWQGQAQPLLPIPHHESNAADGWWSHDGHCWLGAGPITSHCGRFSLVCTGAIVNHLQVRAGLRFQSWRSTSPDETLVEGLAQRGLALVLELRGMFAFAAYDRQKQQLLLGRDRLGIKPLYLSWIEGGLRFASERRVLGHGHPLSGEEISQLLAFGHLQTPATFPGPASEGIRSLPAGMVVRINRTRPHDPVRYWPPQPRPDWSPLPIRSTRWAPQFLLQQLEEAVQQHLLADGPVACLLSTGLDSGVITALASRSQTGRITTVSVLFPGAPLDQQQRTRQMACHCGTDHHEIRLEDDQALSWIEAGLQAMDTPSAAALHTYLVSRSVAAQGFMVALSGLGADALFGGYPSFRILPWLLQLRVLPPALRRTLLQSIGGRLASKLQGVPRWDRWHLGLAVRRWFSDAELAAAGADDLCWPEQPPQRITQPWGQISWAELFGYTEPTLLRDSDGMGKVVGLELRVPYLDHRIVEIALRMPQRFQRCNNQLLRAACADLFPPGYLDTPRQALSLPLRPWMLGPLQQLCLQRLEALQASGWLEPSWITRQWQAFKEGQLHWTRAWSLVVLGEWATREQQP